MGTLLGRWLPHRDRRYRRHFVKGRGSESSEGDSVDALYRKHMLEKNGLTAQVDLLRKKDRRILEEEIGFPFYHRVKEPRLP